jgi:hypothetical protein
MAEQSTGAENQNGGTTAEEPKYITADQVAQIVNQAVTAQLKRSLKGELEGLTKTITESVATQIKASTPEPKTDDSQGGKPDPKYSALEQKFAQMEANYKAAQERAEAAEKKRREDRAFTDLRTKLAEHVRPDMVDVVAENLFYAKKRVTFDEDGNPLFVARRAPAPGMSEEDMPLPLADGIASFLKSKEAEPFLPAPGGKSTGNKASAKPPQFGSQQLPNYDKPATTDEEKTRRAFEREQALTSRGINL